jgi:hypothetical protein
MKKNLYAIIAIGSAWGTFEATLGHILHVFTLGIGWIFWFPAAFFFMNLAYRKTGDLNSVLYSAVIASALKLINLFYPVRPDMVFNPAVSMLFEALSVFIVYNFLKQKSGHIQLNLAVCAAPCIIWRMLYVCYVLFLPEYYIKISPLGGLISFVRFFFLESAANSILIIISILVYEKVLKGRFIMFSGALNFDGKHKIIKPMLSFAAFAAAIAVQIIAV